MYTKYTHADPSPLDWAHLDKAHTQALKQGSQQLSL